MYRPVASLLHTLLEWKWRRLLVSFLVRSADHMLSEKSQWTQNGTMFVDLDWLLNASSPLSASAELLVLFVCHAPNQEHRAFEACIVRTRIALPFIDRFRRGLQLFFHKGLLFQKHYVVLIFVARWHHSFREIAVTNCDKYKNRRKVCAHHFV